MRVLELESRLRVVEKRMENANETIETFRTFLAEADYADALEKREWEEYERTLEEAYEKRSEPPYGWWLLVLIAYIVGIAIGSI